MGTAIEGYTYGTEAAARSPLGAVDLDLLKQSVLFGEEDERALRAAGDVLEDQVEDVLDVWYGFVASHPHLVHYFSDPQTGEALDHYLESVRPRFGQWILDTCRRPYDQDWLDYQEEIALRHTSEKKNKTDDVYSVLEVPLRYLVCFVYPITATMRDFLAKKGASEEEVEAMHQAWFKSVTLQVALWSRPYAGDAW